MFQENVQKVNEVYRQINGICRVEPVEARLFRASKCTCHTVLDRLGLTVKPEIGIQTKLNQKNMQKVNKVHGQINGNWNVELLEMLF